KTDDVDEPDETIEITIVPTSVCVANPLSATVTLLLYNITQVKPGGDEKEIKTSTLLPDGVNENDMFAPTNAELAAMGHTMLIDSWTRYGDAPNPPTGPKISAASISLQSRWLGTVFTTPVGRPEAVAGGWSSTFKGSLGTGSYFRIRNKQGMQMIEQTRSFKTAAVISPNTPIRINRALLIHEDLHFQICLYLTQTADRMLKGYTVQKTAVGPTKAKAIADATNAAKADVLAKYLSLGNDLDGMIFDVNEAYDGLDQLGTNHALDGVLQEWWVKNWKEVCDQVMKNKGWM
ncbi:MAG: hypothetical protein ACRC7O_09160, partial [Fimbriiglobus sp.]